MASRFSSLLVGRGYMAQALKEYFGEVDAVDIHPYGYGMYLYCCLVVKNPDGIAFKLVPGKSIDR